MPVFNPYQIELYSFLGWLNQYHKDIHSQYRSYFGVPIDNTGIRVSERFISGKDFELLSELLQSYYRLQPGVNKYKIKSK